MFLSKLNNIITKQNYKKIVLIVPWKMIDLDKIFNLAIDKLLYYKRFYISMNFR